MSIAAWVLLGGCEPDPVETAAPVETGVETSTWVPDWQEPCDAGDDAWIDRTIRFVWGRRPHGAAEVAVWRVIVEAHGRDEAVRVMTRSDAYLDRWEDWLLDTLNISRTGDRAFGGCFNAPLLTEHDGSLAAFIAENQPTAAWPATFDGADVLRDALVADDVSVAYRVNLFTRMFKPLQGANVGAFDLERNRRDNFGKAFMETYLNRDMVCLACHNSAFSITGDVDPLLDRTWEIPGLYEQALFGSSYGISTDEAFAVFKYEDVVADAGGVAPWGIYDGHCGSFVAASEVGDFLEHDAYFVEAFGQSGSVWQVEQLLHEGVDAIAGGVGVAEDGVVEGPAAFAYLVALSLGNRVWAEATGAPLTIANYFPRNETQRDILQDLGDTLATSHFSLRELLVAVATNPYYNHGGPQGCSGAPDLAPLWNPWTPADDDPAARGNGAGELLHRQSARVLVRSAHDAMGWPQPNAFLATTDPLNEVLVGIGAYMRESQPGFSGTDFQGLIAWEGAYASGRAPSAGGAGNGCAATPTYAGCASCDCEAATCAADPYCCEVQWDDTCVALCADVGGGCGGGLAEDQRDYVARLLDEGAKRGATVRDVASALQDRLIGAATIDDEVGAILEDLVEAPLDAPLLVAPAAEAGLRSFGGALLLSPDFYLAAELAPYGDAPALSLDAVSDCEAAAGMLAAHGLAGTCDPTGRLTTSP